MAFMLKGSTGGGGDYAPLPAGSHAARCIAFVDLGTQLKTWEGKTKQVAQVRITWEVANERMSDGRPFTISKTYAASLGPMATLRKDLEGWRGKAFTEAEINGWAPSQLIGKACLLGVVNTDKNGKTYANVSGVMPLPKGMSVPPQENESIYFVMDRDEIDMEVFEKLTQYVKDTIQKSPEWGQLARGLATSTTTLDDDDVPF